MTSTQKSGWIKTYVEVNLLRQISTSPPKKHDMMQKRSGAPAVPFFVQMILVSFPATPISGLDFP